MSALSAMAVGARRALGSPSSCCGCGSSTSRRPRRAAWIVVPRWRTGSGRRAPRTTLREGLRHGVVRRRTARSVAGSPRPSRPRTPGPVRSYDNLERVALTGESDHDTHRSVVAVVSASALRAALAARCSAECNRPLRRPRVAPTGFPPLFWLLRNGSSSASCASPCSRACSTPSSTGCRVPSVRLDGGATRDVTVEGTIFYYSLLIWLTWRRC